MHFFKPTKVLLLLLSVLLLVSTANAGKKGLGTLIGAGVGAVTGTVAEKKIKEAMEKDTYTGDGFVLTEQGILLKLDEGEVFLNIKKMTDLEILKEVIKTTNRVDVTKKAEWGDLQGRVPVCADDSSCATIIVDITKEKILSVRLAFSDDPSDTFDLIAYQATEPGVGAYVWNFIINNPILVCVILFGLIGFIWDHRSSKKKKAAEQNEAVAEASAEVENKDNNEQV